MDELSVFAWDLPLGLVYKTLGEQGREAGPSDQGCRYVTALLGKKHLEI